MSRRIELNPGDRLPPVEHKYGRLCDNAQGGPYRYGRPLVFNAELIRRIHAGEV